MSAATNAACINLIESISNRIYLNNFRNNDDPVYSFDSTNIWNSLEEKYPNAEEIDSTQTNSSKNK